MGKSKKERQTWTTAEGDVLYVDEMEASHAANTYAMLVRGARRSLYQEWLRVTGYAAMHDGGEVAQDSLDDIAHELGELHSASRDDADIAVRWLWRTRGPLLKALVKRSKAPEKPRPRRTHVEVEEFVVAFIGDAGKGSPFAHSDYTGYRS